MPFSKFLSLAKAPRRVSLVCVSDGNVYDFPDDGGSVDEQGRVKNHSRRANLLACLAKLGKDGQPLYFAGQRKGDSPANWSWESANVEPAYPGDPAAQAPKLGAQEIAKIKANLAKRAEMEASSARNSASEIAKLAAQASKAAAAKGKANE